MTQKPEFQIGGKTYSRIKFGEEATNWGASTQKCASCGVAAGEFHHAGCFVERCPVCRGQVVSCLCEYQESFLRHPMSRARRVFYKLFYLALLPVALIALLLHWLVSLPWMVYAALVVGIPVLLTLGFWNKMGEMELWQVITTRKDSP